MRSCWIVEDLDDLRSMLARVARRHVAHVTEIPSLREAWMRSVAVAHGEMQTPGVVISGLRLADGVSVDWLLNMRRSDAALRAACLSGAWDAEGKAQLEGQGIVTLDKSYALAEELERFLRGAPITTNYPNIR